MDHSVLILPDGCEGDSPAIIRPFPRLQISYARLSSLVRGLHLDLSRLGVAPSSRVVILLPNGAEFAAVFLAVLRQRAVAAPLSPDATPAELAGLLARIKPALVIIPEKASCPSATQLGARTAACRWEDHVLRLVGEGSPTPPVAREEVRSDDKVLMLFTSGTTGPPKAVLLSHANLLVSLRILTAHHRITQGDRTLIITPLYHIIGVVGSLLLTLLTGGCAVIPESLPGRFWQTCADYGITWFHAVPTLHHLLLNFPLPNGRVPSTLRFLRTGGSEMSEDLWGRVSALGPPLLEVYGMTETSPAIFCNRIDGTRQRGCFPIPDEVHVKIREGEVCVRGPSVTDGYDTPQATEEAFVDGYFRTGDLGAMLPDGRLHLLGRIKEVINKGGVKISPSEVEGVATSHAAVEGAACFRIADEVYGDEIGLAVVPGRAVTGVELKKFIRQRLTAYKVPKKIVFVDAIPLGRTGKPMRTELSRKYAEGLL